MNKRLFEYVLRCFYPARCRYCGNVIDIRLDICDSCKNNLQRLEKEICYYCGIEKEFCVCNKKKAFYKSIVAPFYYDGAIHKSIWQLKFRGHKEYVKVIAEEMADCFNKHYSEYSFDYCTCVPMHKDDYKKRENNHAELIAKELSNQLGIEYRDLLIKSFKTKPQHSLTEIERTGNLTGAFDLKTNINLENKRILLCDDVKTTGSTLNECAKTLLIAGASEVLCITGAVVSKNHENKKTLYNSKICDKI